MHAAADLPAPLAIAAELPSWCTPGSRVLDLGAGTGRNAIFLAHHGFEVDAVDASAWAIAQLRARSAERGLAVRAEVMDARASAIEFSCYRVVLCTMVLHLLPPAHARQLLERARAKAGPGTIHAIAAITTRGDFFEMRLPEERYYPEPGEISDGYRACQWQVHREWQEERVMAERRADGGLLRNLVSFTIAGT
jgi:cyclopropane fatty-acyl-phospholipid synthase-like methyltransferase